MSPPSPITLPDCWGHRGASARFPENTLLSFEAAIRDGAEGIESDVHVSLDDVVIMFHDPSLERTTDGTGLIRERNWRGKDGMEHLHTIKEPKQPIPTFEQMIALLMQPENLHVKLDVDVKIENDPPKLFSLMHSIISSHDQWETLLAPRILLGLWHPRFLAHAKIHLPYCARSYIGNDPAVARKYFWSSCDGFSMSFASMVTSSGAQFRKDCKAAGKKVMVWTVNDPNRMVEAARWGVDGILTDKPQTWLELRAALYKNYKKTSAQYNRLFLWTSAKFYSPYQYWECSMASRYLQTLVGPFDHVDEKSDSTTIAQTATVVA